MMAYYTTELRRFLEMLDNRSEHVTLSEIPQLIENTWEKVFTNTCTVESPLDKKDLCVDILNHYFMEEIGFETPSLFLHYLNNRFCEIVPYYNEIAKALAVKYDFLNDTDITITEKVEKEGSVNENNDRNITAQGTTSNTNHEEGNANERYSHGSRIDRFPQGRHDLSDDYLDSVQQDEDSRISDNSSDSNGSVNSEGTSSTTDTRRKSSTDDTNRILTRVGKEGKVSYARYQREYIENLRNIKEEIIDAFEDLFMGLLV